MIVAMILRVALLDKHSLWLDEAITSDQVSGTWWKALTAEATHPPLYRLLVRAVVAISGESDAALRSLSVVLGVATVPEVDVLAGRLFQRARARNIATALFVVSPYAIYLSQEARSYSLMMLLCVTSTTAFLDVLRSHDDRDRNLLGRYGVQCVLLLHTHYFGAWILVCHEVVFWMHNKYARGAWVIMRASVAALMLPWVALAINVHTCGSPAWIPPVAAMIPVAFFRYVMGYGVVAPHAALSNDPVWISIQRESLATIFTLGVTAFVCVYGVRQWAGKRDEKRLVLIVLALPCIVLLALSPWVNLLHDRNLCFQSPFALMLLASGLASMSGLSRSVASFAVAAILAFSLVAYYGAPIRVLGYDARFAKEDWRTAVEDIRGAHVETIYVAPSYAARAVAHYLPRDERQRVVGIDAAPSGTEPRLSRPSRVALVLARERLSDAAMLEGFRDDYVSRSDTRYPRMTAIRVLVMDRANEDARSRGSSETREVLRDPMPSPSSRSSPTPLLRSDGQQSPLRL